MRANAEHAADVPETSLAAAFWAVARRLRHLAQDALAPWDVTPGQVRALATLARHGTMRPSTLAEHLHITPRSATEVVDALAARGLVERGPDPEDRRASLVALTPPGNELTGQVHAARAAEADRLFAVLGERDRAELARLLGVLAGDPV